MCPGSAGPHALVSVIRQADPLAASIRAYARGGCLSPALSPGMPTVRGLVAWPRRNDGHPMSVLPSAFGIVMR